MSMLKFYNLLKNSSISDLVMGLIIDLSKLNCFPQKLVIRYSNSYINMIHLIRLRVINRSKLLHMSCFNTENADILVRFLLNNNLRFYSKSSNSIKEVMKNSSRLPAHDTNAKDTDTILKYNGDISSKWILGEMIQLLIEYKNKIMDKVSYKV